MRTAREARGAALGAGPTSARVAGHDLTAEGPDDDALQKLMMIALRACDAHETCSEHIRVYLVRAGSMQQRLERGKCALAPPFESV